jgi:hypothetical protein
MSPHRPSHSACRINNVLSVFVSFSLFEDFGEWCEKRLVRLPSLSIRWLIRLYGFSIFVREFQNRCFLKFNSARKTTKLQQFIKIMRVNWVL